ncbi:chemotaxis protein CheW [Halorhodospira halophila]|uniref:Putative CheW protein n=1 Tax=Halorhodospira halophila (strain DSM 244 / SL1) TaxID=349124 RepID=A1WU96_HALHL|nr:chemotaxis protein CheW [Halorhodospira halophila]ABM61258.1 putative CheW protein [Halorhodospira halophila SL1]MBK1730010.1 chemotaxis protein CheW [Halorhodospira halophila]
MAYEQAQYEDDAELAEGPTSQWVTFKLGNEHYGINVMQVQEVLPLSEIAPVPGAPEFVLGIINLRGKVVTVIDTRLRFGMKPREADKQSRIIVMEVAENVAGILVDSVDEVASVREAQIDTAPNVGNEESSRYIYGVVSREDGLLILVDANKLLTEDEWQEVAAL